MNCQRRSRASFGSALATLSTIARRWVSRSPARALTPCQSTNDRDRAMVVSRLRTSFASSLGLCAPASSSLRRRLAAGLPELISISSSASRSAPRACRLVELSVVFVATAEVSLTSKTICVNLRPPLLDG
jgi:hypothetical protein